MTMTLADAAADHGGIGWELSVGHQRGPRTGRWNITGGDDDQTCSAAMEARPYETIMTAMAPQAG